MGANNQCCAVETVKQDYLVEDQKASNGPSLNNTTNSKMKMLKLQMRKNRNGDPNNDEYISLNNPQQIENKIHAKPQIIINEYKKNERKFKKYLKLSLKPKKQNQISSPYYLRQQHAIYSGQWAFDDKLKQNVPDGIGRLYESDYISEGEITTILHWEQENGEQKCISRVTLLKGIGRKYNLLELMQGQFEDGVLNGRGVYQRKQKDFAINFQNEQRQKEKSQGSKTMRSVIAEKSQKDEKTSKKEKSEKKEKQSQKREKQSEKKISTIVQQQDEDQGNALERKCVEYSYDGIWLMGTRNGRAVQIVKNFVFSKKAQGKGIPHYKVQGYTYQGDFLNDRRTGRGKFTLHLSAQKKNKVMQDDLVIQKPLADYNLKLAFHEQEDHRRQIFFAKWYNDILNATYKWEQTFRQEMDKRNSLMSNKQFRKLRKFKKFYNETYEGEFVDDKFNGEGVYTWFNGKIYNGDWVDGKMHGKGEFLWPQGTIYKGQYSNDLRHGRGMIVWNPYKMWRGNWAYGLRHGYGQSISIKEEQIIAKQTIRKKVGVTYVEEQVQLPPAKQLILTVRGEKWIKNTLQQKPYFVKKHRLVEDQRFTCVQHEISDIQSQDLMAELNNKDRMKQLDGLSVANDQKHIYPSKIPTPSQPNIFLEQKVIMQPEDAMRLIDEHQEQFDQQFNSYELKAPQISKKQQPSFIAAGDMTKTKKKATTKNVFGL